MSRHARTFASTIQPIQPCDRRRFLQAAGALTVGAAMTSALPASAADAAADKPIKKAVKSGMIRSGGSWADKFRLLKELGYDGVEMGGPREQREEILAASQEVGLPIHGVVCYDHWGKPLSDSDPAVRQAGRESLEFAIQDSKFYGGTTVLLVPAVVSKEVSYRDAYHRSQAEIRKVLPLAADLGIRVLFENVWNNFLLSPMETARYIDEFDSPLVGAYFDVGNVVRYGWPEDWIRTLGPRIGKLDIKEYSRKKADDEGVRKGFQVELGEGDCDWPAVMAALREINFTGWGTAEVPGGDEARLREIAERMDRCFAG